MYKLRDLTCSLATCTAGQNFHFSRKFCSSSNRGKINHKYFFIGKATTVYKFVSEDEDNLPRIGLLSRGDGKYFSCIIILNHR